MANLTRTRQAVLIEPLRPERFTVSKREGGAWKFHLIIHSRGKIMLPTYHPQVRTFNATSLYILSICEVCGSYQCPYCPFYSSAPPLASSAILAALTVIVSGSFHMK